MLHSSHNLICVVAMFCLSADVATFTQPHLCCCYVLSVSRPCNLHTASLVAMFCLSADIATLTQPHLCCCYVLSVSRPCNPHTASLVLLLCSVCQQTLQPLHSLNLTQSHDCCCILSVFVKDPTTCQYYKMWCWLWNMWGMQTFWLACMEWKGQGEWTACRERCCQQSSMSRDRLLVRLRVPGSWSKGHKFDSQHEWQEYFLLPS